MHRGYPTDFTIASRRQAILNTGGTEGQVLTVTKSGYAVPRDPADGGAADTATCLAFESAHKACATADGVQVQSGAVLNIPQGAEGIVVGDGAKIYQPADTAGQVNVEADVIHLNGGGGGAELVLDANDTTVTTGNFNVGVTSLKITGAGSVGDRLEKTASNGVQFVTPVAYSSGTFSPAIALVSSVGGVSGETLTVMGAFYQRIGNIVHASYRLRIQGITDGSNDPRFEVDLGAPPGLTPSGSGTASHVAAGESVSIAGGNFVSAGTSQAGIVVGEGFWQPADSRFHLYIRGTHVSSIDLFVAVNAVYTM